MPKLQDWLAKAEQEETVCLLASSGLDTNDSALLIDRNGSTQSQINCIIISQDVFGYRHSKKVALQLWSHQLNMQINSKHRTLPTGKLADKS